MTDHIIDIQPEIVSIQNNDLSNIDQNYLMNGVYVDVTPGEKMKYNTNITFNYIKKFLYYLSICIFYPISFWVFIFIYLGQFCSPLCYDYFGNKWCYHSSQISYTHTLYVIRNTIIGWGKSSICGLSEKIGVLFVTKNISSPPLFIYNENIDTPELLPFKRYCEEIKNNPNYSGKYRAIDGSGNRHQYTFLGQGGRGYAQSLPFQILSIKPNSNSIVERLYKRIKFIPGINGVNSLSTWFANVAIHDFFRSANNIKKYNMDKSWVNLNSSYLDLQVLYGYNKNNMERTRTFNHGKLYRVAEDRMEKIPESKAIIILLMKEHNYICDMLKEKYPFNFTTDEQIYQQARLIMGGVYINIIQRTYGSVMFSENAPNGNGFTELRGKYPGVQLGNHNSINFNILYQWHSTIPEEWTLERSNLYDTTTNEGLKKIFTDMVSNKSGAHSSHNTPDVLKHASINLIENARRCGAPRLNDFRRINSIPYRDFNDMCDNQETAKILSEFYPTIEDVELVVGVQVERSGKAGWGLSNTVEQSIISDAFCSIFNDRFYTDDYRPEIYTEWGYNHTKTTNLADLLNRHLQMNIDRNKPLEKMNDWKISSSFT